MKLGLTVVPSCLLALLPFHALAMPAPPADLNSRAVTTCRVVNADSEVNCRAGPGFDYGVRTFVYPNGIYDFSCYKSGDCYNGNWQRARSGPRPSGGFLTWMVANLNALF
ncbi:hypothetical protein BDW72DRAFT_195237 [Aspergillus terricola var. indicus]